MSNHLPGYTGTSFTPALRLKYATTTALANVPTTMPIMAERSPIVSVNTIINAIARTGTQSWAIAAASGRCTAFSTPLPTTVHADNASTRENHRNIATVSFSCSSVPLGTNNGTTQSASNIKPTAAVITTMQAKDINDLASFTTSPATRPFPALMIGAIIASANGKTRTVTRNIGTIEAEKNPSNCPSIPYILTSRRSRTKKPKYPTAVRRTTAIP